MSTRNKLLLILTTFAVVPSLAFGAFLYLQARGSIQAVRLAQLGSLADLKRDRIHSFFEEREADVRTLQNSFNLRSHLPVLVRLRGEPGHPEYQAAKKALDRQLQPMQRLYGYLDILLTDAEGAVVYVSDDALARLLGAPFEDRELFARARHDFSFSSVQRHVHEENRILLFAAAPLLDDGGAFQGEVVVQIELGPSQDVILDASGLGQTGEVVIAHREGDAAVLVYPTRSDAGAALRVRVPIGARHGQPIQDAVRRGNGSGLALDYRGAEVIAAWRYVPELGWGLVTKIDTAEAFAPVTALLRLVALAGALLLALGILAAFVTSRAITRGQEQAEARMRAERQRLDTVLETVPAYVVLLTPDHHVAFANRYFRERFGESCGRRCFEFLFEQDRPCENCETFKVLRTGRPHDWVWTGPDGRTYEVHDFPFADSDGSPLVMEMGIDITDRKRAEDELVGHREHLEELVRERTAALEAKNTELTAEIAERLRAEEALRQSESTLRGILDATKESIWLFTPEGRVVLANPTALKRFGKTLPEVVGRHISEDLPAELSEPRLARLAEAVQSRGAVEFEDRRAGMSFAHSFYPVLGPDGQVKAVATFSRDITQSRQAEEVLRESEERLKRAQEIAHLGSWELDLIRDRLTWSEEVYNIFGLQPQDAVPSFKAFLALVHPEDREAVESAYTRSLKDESDGYEIQHRVVRPATGEVRHVHERCGHIRDASGRIVRSVGMVHDITAHKRAEEGLQQALARLEAVNHELEEFAHIVSHDLKAPLRAISTLAGMLAKDYRDKLDAEGREQVELLVNRVQRMYGLIDGILQYSRLGRVQEERELVDLNEVVDQVVDLISPPAHIKIVRESTLPTVHCDRTRLQQVFQNLVGNAVKFMDKPQGEVRIGASARDGEVALYVADNGPGIEEKHFERVFKVFQTLHSRDDIEGTGIGLAIVKKIVEAYEGRLWLESKPGQGSTFLFTLKTAGRGA